MTTNDIRETFLFIVNGCRQLTNIPMREEMAKAIAFNSIVSTNYTDNEALNRLFGEEIIRNTAFIQGLTEAISITDLYLELNKKCSLGIINNAELRILNMIISCAQKEDDEKRYNQLFMDSKIQLRLVDAILNFLDSSAFEKVLSFKCLTLDDIELLSFINPLFEDDYEKYSVNIDRDFFIRQISKWINGTNDKVTAFSEASKFLIQAFKININVEELVMDIINFSETEDVMQALVDENADLLAAYISSYYDKYKEISPKLK